MPTGKGNQYPWKRSKILVEPLSNIDYATRLAARIAWNSNAMFRRIGIDGDGQHINRDFAENPHNKIGEVTIQFAKGTQAIVVKMPALSKELIAQLSTQE